MSDQMDDFLDEQRKRAEQVIEALDQLKANQAHVDADVMKLIDTETQRLLDLFEQVKGEGDADRENG